MRIIKTVNRIWNIFKGIFLNSIRIKDGKEIKRELREKQYQAALNKKKCIINSSLYDIDMMKGEEFEKYLKLCFEELNYTVRLTPKSKDYGADLILYKDGVKIVVQTKRSKRPVGISAVQQVTSAIKHYNADKAMIITNNYFTKYAYNLARSNEIELWDRKKLIEFRFRVKNSNIPPEKDNFS